MYEKILSTLEYNINEPDMVKDYRDTIIPFAMTMFREVIPVKNEEGMYCMKETIVNLRKIDKIRNINGIEMSGCALVSLIGFVAEVPRSKLLKQSMGKDPYYASLTPLFLLAQREQRSIKYSEWDYKGSYTDTNKTTKKPMTRYYIETGLGNFLAGIPRFLNSDRNKGKPDIDSEDIALYRKIALTVGSGKDAGTLRPITSNTCNWHGYPKPINILILQQWIANANVREVDTMLLDPWDWDNIPPAHDETVVSNIIAPNNGLSF